jgi:hypothetical protein
MYDFGFTNYDFPKPGRMTALPFGGRVFLNRKS